MAPPCTRSRIHRYITRFALVVCIGGAGGTRLPAQEPSYTRDIRPILSRNCFRCHGPDASQRKAELRLDRPSNTRHDKLVARISSTDPGEVMPPPDSGKSLDAAQIGLLKRWVGAGSPYERHWSFVPPERPALPATNSAAPHSVDRFVHARLERAGLQPSPPADRLTLARRVYLDLIGLPPTPEEADAFARDRSPAAYAELVDRLLASPHYGERWARRWLDLARYADTNGYEKDRDRSIWSYRDWVIRALNSDMGYDRFAIEQLAGDMLPDPTPAQQIATGFHRNTMLNEEGGIDPLEFRFHAMTDRVATTGTVFMGLTMGCAQCHTHKFDPITQTDYYGLMAFLNNADEPDYFVPDPATERVHRENLDRAHAELEALPEKWPDDAEPLEERFEAWLAQQRTRAAKWSTLVPAEATTNLPLLTVEADGVVFGSGDTTKHDTYRLRYPAVNHAIAALRIEALPDDRLPARGPGMTYYEGTKGDFFLSEFRLRAGGESVAIQSAAESYAKNRFGNQPVGAALAIDGDLQTGWSVHGRIGERHLAVFVLSKPIEAGTPLELEMHFGRHFGSSLGKFRVSATEDLGGGAAIALGEDVERLLACRDDQLSEMDRTRLRAAFLLAAPEVKDHANRIHDLRRPPARTTTLVLRERPETHPRPTHRHHRGEFLQPLEVVEPGVPEALHEWPAGVRKDRLGFARWLVSRDNPLAARVVVNRHWAALLGRGLVRTLDDFGAQGEMPSHPELLDWLAVEFMESGWSLKALHRLIVTSATYRQSSIVTAEHLARDPDNRLLARAPRFRLEAEILRDSALRSAGILSTEMFGLPVRPPQPDGITEVTFGSPRWRTSQGDDRVRRSIYTFIKRTAPFALFQTFDAPSGEACTVRRDVSNTALQALSLLNDPQMLEIARAMGAQLAESQKGRDGIPGATVRDAFRRVLTRPPTAPEVGSLVSFVERQRQKFSADLEMARKVCGVAAGAKDGDASGDADTDSDDAAIASRAAWTALARALFSLDEALTRN